MERRDPLLSFVDKKHGCAHREQEQTRSDHQQGEIIAENPSPRTELLDFPDLVHRTFQTAEKLRNAPEQENDAHTCDYPSFGLIDHMVDELEDLQKHVLALGKTLENLVA